MMRFCSALWLCLVLSFAGVSARAAGPNIILIIADDVSAEDIGAYGNKGIQTPNFDRMAHEGMRFDKAFLTCSSCSPSRASILTGRYPHMTGAEQLHWPLPGEQIGFTELLRKAGYYTAAVGKWHLGPAAKSKFDLVEERPLEVPKKGGPEAKAAARRDGASGCTQWVKTLQDRPKDKPFFCWFASHDAHRPYEDHTIPKPHQPSDIMIPPYLPDTLTARKELAQYYDEISRLDRYVGDVFAELERQKVADNTLVIFIADNGRPFPRSKTTVLDSGIRTPFIARWPPKIKAGSVSTRLVSSVDLAPTFLSLAGVKPTPNFVGTDFSPIFKDPKKLVREYVYAEHNWHDYEARSRAVRSEKFKYVRHDYSDLPMTPPADAVKGTTFQEMRHLRDEGKLTAAQMVVFQKRPKEELYDTEADPHELKNLANDKAYAKTLTELRKVLAQWGKDMDDRVPATRTQDNADRETGERLPQFQERGPRVAPKDRKYLDVYDTSTFDVN